MCFKKKPLERSVRKPQRQQRSASITRECFGALTTNNPSHAAPSLLRPKAPHHSWPPRRRRRVMQRIPYFALAWSQQVCLHVGSRIELHAIPLEPNLAHRRMYRRTHRRTRRPRNLKKTNYMILPIDPFRRHLCYIITMLRKTLTH